MSKTIFHDPALQKAFDTDGFVQIPLLTPEDIARLRATYAHYFPDAPTGFHSSSYLDDYHRKKEISEAAVAIIGPRLARHFKDYTVFGSAFLAKTAGPRSEMPMHQDWTIVDETQFVAVNIWTPLQDANKANGSLEVIRGSHAFAPVLRAPTLPFFWEGYSPEMRQALTPLEVKATEAVVLNQALVHCSPPNTTPHNRLAITTGLKSAGAPMRFHYQATPGEVEVFAMDDDFLLHFEDFHEAIYRRPTLGQSLGTRPYAHPDPGRAAILAFLRQAAPPSAQFTTALTNPAPARKSFWHRLKLRK